MNIILNKLLLVFSILLFAFDSHSKQKVHTSNLELVYSFDTIKYQDRYVEHCFFYKNTFEEDVIINDVRANCSCVQSLWSREPIKPGDSTCINVLYKIWSLGTFDKSLKVTTNKGNFRLRIKGLTIK